MTVAAYPPPPLPRVLFACTRSNGNSILAEKVTPGKKSPTVSPLEDGAWCAVSSLVQKKGVSEVMDKLAGLGGTDILVFAITNSRM